MLISPIKVTGTNTFDTAMINNLLASLIFDSSALLHITQVGPSQPLFEIPSNMSMHFGSLGESMDGSIKGEKIMKFYVFLWMTSWWKK